MYILFLNLKATELIINTGSYTGASLGYWLKERKRILKEILKRQIIDFNTE